MDRTPDALEERRRRSAGEMLREFGGKSRLVVYIAAAPGAGKTRRLLSDGRHLLSSGNRVAIGSINTKGRPELERLAEGFTRIAPRRVESGGRTYEEFDLAAAIAAKPEFIILDELAHENIGDAPNRARWQDALALREAGISVLGAFNISHLDTVAATAESLIGAPVNGIVPLSFLKTANDVVALDASPELLRQRLHLNKGAVEGGNGGEAMFSESSLTQLRELLLRTIDDLTIPIVSAAVTSAATAIVTPNIDVERFLSRAAPVAAAFDLSLEVLPATSCSTDAVARCAATYDAEMLPPEDPQRVDFGALRASMIAVPNDKFAAKLVNTRVERDIVVVDASQSYLEQSAFTTPLSGTLGDRMRVGYGKLTVYLGAAAGAGKTYAMLDRGQQLMAEGVDVVVGFAEPHGRAETAAMIDDLPVIPRKTIAADGVTYAEMDRDAILARKPRVVLVDELAHINVSGSLAPKRFMDVLAFLRAGIDVITTLNVAHLEALSDVVYRLTGSVVRETLPDGILPLADEVILIDVSPEALRERLREGKIYPPDRIEAALSNFFRTDNLASMRELALREAIRCETRERIAAPFDRLLISVVARPEDRLLIRKASRLALRLEVDFAIAHIAEPRDRVDPKTVEDFERIARSINAEWIDEKSNDAAKRLIEVARMRPETMVAVGGTHRTPRWPARAAFARRLLDEGARELIVLARPAPPSDAPVVDPE